MLLWIQSIPDTTKYPQRNAKNRHVKKIQVTDKGDACFTPHARACTPFSQSLPGTTPTARHTGQLTSTNPPARSREPSFSGAHPATRSALTKHAGWNVCSHPDA